MTYVPRSPRRSTTLRAVVGGEQRGRVRDMSTSGLFVETQAPLLPGAPVAVVPLCGELDGERLPAEVVRVGKGGLALRFVGLDVDRRQSLRALLTDGASARAVRRPSPVRHALPAVPAGAPVLLLTDEISEVHELPAAATTLSTSGSATAEQQVELHAELQALEDQLIELGLRNARILDENAALALRVRALEARVAMRARLEQDLFEAYDTIEELERQNDRLIARIIDGR